MDDPATSMPSPATPHRPSDRGGSAKSSPTKHKSLDIGQPLGIYDTNSVRAKVRQWQQQGGGVITANDVVYYEEDEEDDENSKTDSSKSKTVKGDTNNISRAPTRKRSKSTPRKRVISDEHWKLDRNRNRNSTQTQTPSVKLPPPKRISQYTINDPLPSPRQDHREGEGDEKGRPFPSSRSQDKDKTAAGATSQPVIRERRKSKVTRDIDSFTASEIDEESTKRNGSSKPALRPRTADKPQVGDKSVLTERIKGKDDFPGIEFPEIDTDWATSEANFSELSKIRARGPPKSRGTLKSPKGGIFGHMFDESRKIFSRPEPPKPIPSRGTKIEAWLSETSDPFTDDMKSDVEIPAPLNPKSSRAKQSKKREENHDPVTNHEVSPESGTRQKPIVKQHVRSKEGKSTTIKTDSKELKKDSPSPSPRKRPSEHRHSKSSSSTKEIVIRERALDEKTEAEASDTETHPFSDGSEVSGNNAPVPLARKRPFPGTGFHQLSTIASVTTLSTVDDNQSQAPLLRAPSENHDASSVLEKDESEERDQFDPNSLPVVASQLKRRLTTHDDLISVLSARNTRSRSIRSARSLRSNRNLATVPDLLKELSADEVKYMRELKTLVGGVIPVLLTCVLSRSDSAIAAGLFRPSTDPKDEMNFSKPIVDMGVAIERLKTLHKRIPLEDVDNLLNWAQGAQRVYRDYLRAWRLGFKDVVVNLAPLEEGEAAKNSDTRSLDEGMARDENGDVVDSDGEKVDVAYLLKRPLVRLKYLSKTFKGINTLQPSTKAEELASGYQNLVIEARRRAREERARLEDESAANIDATRARDLETLGALTEVSVDKTRRVRARDFFNLSLYHSTGQVIDCRAEFLLRDNLPENGAGGDLLICEIDHAERWLLFPPMDLGCVSARSGDTKGEVVVMLRSSRGQAKPWQELLLLRIDEEDIALEWVRLLGLNPIPPAICRSQSFIDRARQRQRAQTISSSDHTPSQKTPPSPTNVNIPIGEKANSRTVRRSSTPKEPLSDPSTIETTTATDSRISLYSAITRESDYATDGSPQSQLSILPSRGPRKNQLSDERASAGLKRSKAMRVKQNGENASPTTQKDTELDNNYDLAPSTPRQDYERKTRADQSPGVAREKNSHKKQHPPKTPTRNTPETSPRVSSVPSRDLPNIPKLRKGSSQTHISQSLASTSDEEEYASLDSYSLTGTPTKSKRHSRSDSESSQMNEEEPPPPPPPHRSPSSTGSGPSNTPILSPSGVQQRRRGSSPLKHEYQPSTASDSYSDSDTSTVRRYDLYSDSDFSASDTSDDGSEDDLSSPLTPVEAQNLSTSALATSSSSSLSQGGGYRSVPSQPTKSSTAIASVFAWSDKGTWESVLPDECKIMVSPGLIEAYEMSTTEPWNNDVHLNKGQLLVALELTPLVPIRRGTAIDISIRSPPTERSKINWSNNIMFRSRNADECEALYGLINQARINNPTYIALQNARGPFADQPAPLEPSAKTGGWFGWPRRRKSYRASNSPRSLADNSESSVGTMSSAFSALKRFGTGNKMFNIARSSITSQSGSGSNHSTSGIGRIAAAIKNVDGIGLSNAKIRLYMRETQSKWRDMGAARLTIMPASPAPRRPDTAGSRRSDTSAPAEDDGSPPASGAVSPRRGMESQKRILIRGKTRGETLLDVCLGETAFERVARTGIAVSVSDDNDSKALPKEGGVTGITSKVYMIQMKSEAEAAYTFGLVGKLRY